MCEHLFPTLPFNPFWDKRVSFSLLHFGVYYSHVQAAKVCLSVIEMLFLREEIESSESGLCSLQIFGKVSGALLKTLIALL